VPRLAAMAVTVLLVDDHDGFRSTARALLEGDGYEVIGDTADGFSALDAARRLRPDVVLLDVQLPDIDGFEVTRRLQRGGDTPAVVLISSRDRVDLASRLDRSAAKGFISKGDLSAATLSAVLDGERPAPS
jgi:DNA-binding NarL/FixJ family response regulator